VVTDSETSDAEVFLITQKPINIRVPFICHNGAVAVRAGTAEGYLGIKPGWRWCD